MNSMYGLEIRKKNTTACKCIGRLQRIHRQIYIYVIMSISIYLAVETFLSLLFLFSRLFSTAIPRFSPNKHDFAQAFMFLQNLFGYKMPKNLVSLFISIVTSSCKYSLMERLKVLLCLSAIFFSNSASSSGRTTEGPVSLSSVRSQIFTSNTFEVQLSYRILSVPLSRKSRDPMPVRGWFQICNMIMDILYCGDFKYDLKSPQY